MQSLSGSSAIWIADNCHFLSLARFPWENTGGCQPCCRWVRCAVVAAAAGSTAGPARAPVQTCVCMGTPLHTGESQALREQVMCCWPLCAQLRRPFVPMDWKWYWAIWSHFLKKSSPFTSKQIQRPCQKSKLSCKGSKIHSISCLTAFIRLTEHSYICKANTRGFVINICISTYAHPGTYRCKCLDALRQQTTSAVQSSGNGLFTSPGQFIR